MRGVVASTVAGVYPISTTSYLLVPTKLDPAKADNLVAFLNYAFSSTGQGEAPGLGYAPLPDSVLKTALAAVARLNPAAPPPAAAPAATTTTTAKPAPKPAVAAASTTAPAAAPDPALASTGSSSALTAALAGLLLALGGLGVGLGRRRKTVRA